MNAAEAAGVVLGVVHHYLFLPEFVAACRIASGELGAVRAVTVNYLGVLDLPGAGGYCPMWRHDPSAAGGGVLMDMLHAVYLAEHLLGASFTRVSGVADADLPGTRSDGVETLALARFEADQAERTSVAILPVMMPAAMRETLKDISPVARGRLFAPAQSVSPAAE